MDNWSRRRRRVIRTAAGFVLVTLAMVHYRLWVAEDGVVGVVRLQQMVEVQSAQNEDSATRNARLEAEVGDLKDGLQAVEERARRELGMIRRDETYFQFVDFADDGDRNDTTATPSDSSG